MHSQVMFQEHGAEGNSAKSCRIAIESHAWAARRRSLFRGGSWLRVAVLSLGFMVGAGGFVSTALAHKLILFATVRGQAIEGEVYYQGGTSARDVTVNVVAPDGETLETLTTDADGKFSYYPNSRFVHRFIADAGMGHQTEYVVPAEELPEGLPDESAARAGRTAVPVGTELEHMHDHGGADHRNDGVPASPAQAFETVDAEAIQQQIAVLRRDMQRWHTRLRLQDVLGGIGYIVGIFGAWAYLTARRQNTN